MTTKKDRMFGNVEYKEKSTRDLFPKDPNKGGIPMRKNMAMGKIPAKAKAKGAKY